MPVWPVFDISIAFAGTHRDGDAALGPDGVTPRRFLMPHMTDADANAIGGMMYALRALKTALAAPDGELRGQADWRTVEIEAEKFAAYADQVLEPTRPAMEFGTLLITFTLRDLAVCVDLIEAHEPANLAGNAVHHARSAWNVLARGGRWLACVREARADFAHGVAERGVVYRFAKYTVVRASRTAIRAIPHRLQPVTVLQIMKEAVAGGYCPVSDDPAYPANPDDPDRSWYCNVATPDNVDWSDLLNRHHKHCLGDRGSIFIDVEHGLWADRSVGEEALAYIRLRVAALGRWSLVDPVQKQTHVVCVLRTHFQAHVQWVGGLPVPTTCPTPSQVLVALRDSAVLPAAARRLWRDRDFRVDGAAAGEESHKKWIRVFCADSDVACTVRPPYEELRVALNMWWPNRRGSRLRQTPEPPHRVEWHDRRFPGE